MDTLHLSLSIGLVLAIFGLVIGIIVWFRKKKHKPSDTSRLTATTRSDYVTSSASDDNNSNNESIIMFIFVFGFIAVILGVSIWLSVKRYQIADDAIKRGDTGTALAALAPEIGAGISDVVEGVSSFH